MSNIKIAIHASRHTLEWIDIWKECARKSGIECKMVDCLSNYVITELKQCSALLYFPFHQDPAEMRMLKPIVMCAELIGLRIWPDLNTSWHFDDKISQKYLLEALNIPSPRSWTFYDKNQALEFSRSCPLPLVGKQSRGAGGLNIHMLDTRKKLRAYIRRMFGRGYPSLPAPWKDMNSKLRNAHKRGGISALLKKIARAPSYYKRVVTNRKLGGLDIGYVYLQEYMPDNAFDFRVSIINGRAWAYRRMNRPHDFRASGSGDHKYDGIPPELIKLSFRAAEKLRMQSAGLDWMVNRNGEYMLIEVNMCFNDMYVTECPGYWNKHGAFTPGNYSPARYIFECISSEGFYELHEKET